jgi:hypothetical protein
LTSSSGSGYAIPIDDDLAVARQIVAGPASATVPIGDPSEFRPRISLAAEMLA